MTVLSTGWSLLATACLLWPGVGTSEPDSALPAGFEGERLQFELLVLGPVLMVLVACSVYVAFTRSHASRPPRNAVALDETLVFH